MTTEIDICNMALSHLGAHTAISDFQEDSVEAQQCRLLYEPARDAVLRAHAWNFAMRQQALARIEATPATWAYQYALPIDCLVARKLVSSVPGVAPVEFEVMGTNLYTNQQRAVLTYTARLTDARQFDPLFVVALSWRLATDLAPPITGSKTIQKTTQSIFRNELMAAMAADAQEGQRQPQHKVEWIQVRS